MTTVERKDKDMSTGLEQKIIEISMEVFGTPDFESMLSVLPPYDGAVREFRQRAAVCKENTVSQKGII